MTDGHPTVRSFIPPAATAGGVDVALYDEPLSSRDGFLLLAGRTVRDLCLCNPLTGTCRILPAAAFGVSKPLPCTYVLVTGHDSSTPTDGSVWILAAKRVVKGGMTMVYQIFSSISGEWGPAIEHSTKFEKDLARALMYAAEPKYVAVCRGSVYWMGMTVAGDHPRRCTLAFDVQTGRTWTTELPEKHVGLINFSNLDVLATSEDGRLSLIVLVPPEYQVEVWVLIADGRWTLRRTIGLPDLLSKPFPEIRHVWLGGFCSRSGCLFGVVDEEDLVIDIGRGFLRQTARYGAGIVTKYPYEMDWSTYLSKMKYF